MIYPQTRRLGQQDFPKKSFLFVDEVEAGAKAPRTDNIQAQALRICLVSTWWTLDRVGCAMLSNQAA